MLNGLPTGDRMLYPPAGRFFILRAMDRSMSQAQGIANCLKSGLGCRGSLRLSGKMLVYGNNRAS